MNERTTLTDRLDLALAAGVPATELERAGLSKNIEAQWVFTIATGSVYESEFRCDRIKGQSALFAFERVVIEWMGEPERRVTMAPQQDGTWGVWFPGKPAVHGGPTLSAALTAALAGLRAMKEGK